MFKKIVKATPELISRAVIGLIFIQSGWGKFQDLDKVRAYFESIAIPYAQFQAPFVAGVELIAGVMILVGLMTRLASVPLIITMLVAIRATQWEEVTGLSSLFGISEFLYIVILVWLLVRGAKFLSIDSKICKTCKSKSCSND